MFDNTNKLMLELLLFFCLAKFTCIIIEEIHYGFRDTNVQVQTLAGVVATKDKAT